MNGLDKFLQFSDDVSIFLSLKSSVLLDLSYPLHSFRLNKLIDLCAAYVEARSRPVL